MIVFGGAEYGRPDPLAPSDTVNNLLNGDTGALAVQNRSASALLVSITFAGDMTRTVAIPAYGVLRWGHNWKRVNATGTTGGGHSAQRYELYKTTAVGLAFTNQPANDGIEIVSASAADTTQSITLYGTTQGTDTVVAETVTLNGTTAVATVKTDWGLLLGYELSASCAGTVTVREASGNATISTITTGLLSKGVETVSLEDLPTTPPVLVASGATTKQIGVAGTDLSGAVAYDSQALTGATAVEMNSSFGSITKIFTGDLEGTVTVSVYNGSDLLAYW